MAKLLVPAGAPLQLNCGERLRPPQPVKTNSMSIFWPSLMDSLCTRMAPGCFAGFGARTETFSKSIADVDIKTSNWRMWWRNDYLGQPLCGIPLVIFSAFWK